MKKKNSLLETNKYLRDPEMREKLLFENAVESARIEGVKNARKKLKEVLKRSSSPRKA